MEIQKKQMVTIDITHTESEWNTIQLLYDRLFKMHYDDDSDFCLSQDEFVIMGNANK